jgi:hypothetical protein
MQTKLKENKAMITKTDNMNLKYTNSEMKNSKLTVQTQPNQEDNKT